MNSVVAFFSWYIILTLLGWITFPLAYRLFPALADRGYSLSRTAGLLTWSYVFWLFTSLGLTQNNSGGILFSLLILIGLSLALFFTLNSGSPDQKTEIGNRKSELLSWLRDHLRLILTTEVLFLAAFAFLALLRAGNPELDGTERPMELMFINAILRSPTFPPHDSWLSGYAISYYYFGYVMTAMLAKLTGLIGSVAHNLMTSLIFALAAIGAYGILYNLLAHVRSKSKSEDPKPSVGFPLLGPLFLLLVSNLEGFLEVLHQRGIFWSGSQNFWTWLGIQDLNSAPMRPLGWIPERFWWWWRASRVISDYDLAGHFSEVIDEFPFFSFLLGDLHPHVLAIPFNLLAVAVALNIFLGGWRGETNLFGLRLGVNKTGFFAAALLLGGLAFLNTWDILVAAALIVLSYVFFRIRQDGWSWVRLEDLFALGLPLGLLSLLLYLPFYFGFSSQAGGILPNLVNPTRGAQLWVMFAPLFIPLFAYLLYAWRGEKRKANWSLALLLGVGFVILLWVFSWLMGWGAFVKDHAFAESFLASQGMADLRAFFNAATMRRLAYLGGLITLLAIFIPALAFLMREGKNGNGSKVSTGHPSAFVFLLIVLGALLVITPDFVYLRDQFGYRINTVFKFYYQAWLLWSLGAAFGVAILLQNLRSRWDWVFRGVLTIMLFTSLTYPALSIANKTNNFDPVFGWTLNDFTRIQRTNPDEAAGIQWLKSAPYGVVTEAVGGSYTGYARISTYTGLPTVLGWPGHESQWRGGGAPQGTRENDIKLLYSTPSWKVTRDILTKYHIRYVYIGGLERSTYPLQGDKFHQNLIQVFQQGSVTIYQVP